MDSRFYFLAIICVAGGLVGGYLITSTTFQNQIMAYQLGIQSQDAEITAKDALLGTKDAQIQAQAAEIQAQVAQLQANDVQLQAQSTIIQTQKNLLQQLKANITVLQEQIQSIIDQLQTQVRIDSVTWGSASFTLDVRNTGIVNANIESVSISTNQAGSTPIKFEVQRSIPVASHSIIIITYQWATSTSYIIRLTTSTGLYYEAVSTSPAT